MAKLAPFAGLRYAPALGRVSSRLITPPYDIISPADQLRFYRAHPHNIIRLELGKTKASDTPRNNRYTRARRTLEQWLAQGVLRVESEEAFYLLKTDYTDPRGRHKRFTGLFARVQLEAFGEGKVFPHEKTYEGPKTDRFHLLAETGVSFSPVLSLYRDQSGTVGRQLERQARPRPALSLRDWNGCRHRLWVIQQPRSVAALQKEFLGKKLLIADGHHRYLTAISYQREQGARVGTAANYVMMCLAGVRDPGLSVLPVIRLVRGVEKKRWASYHRRLKETFEIIKATPAQLVNGKVPANTAGLPVIGYLGDGGRSAFWLRVRPGALDQAYGQTPARHSRIYHRLDVVILNQLVLEPWLGIGRQEEKGRVSYTKNPVAARRAVSQGKAQAAFFPGLPNVDAIWDLAKQGETLPPKSTYFLPKIITGLVMNPVSLKKG